ncbi:MAG: hypothetical protein IJK81_06705 [Selenomonadaceae bacterium]|nr:hypothetical protein [Selenomonadaceae bacterium]
MSRFMDKVLLIFMVFVISAAAFEGFFVKWHFNEIYKHDRNSFKVMYEGTAHKPFVYRQLLISVSKGITEILPNETKETLINKIKKDNFLADKFKKVRIEDKFLIEYYTVYFLAFLCLFASVFVWRKICIDLTGDSIAGTLAPLAFTIIFPYLQTNGGHFYDFSELLFFSLATYFALKGHYLALIFMTPIAAHNKESFFFFLLTLYPLLRRIQTRKNAIMVLGISMLLAGLTYLLTFSKFAGNAGFTAEYHLIHNVIVSVICAYFFAVYLLCKKTYTKSPLISYAFFLIFIVVMFILCGSEFPLNLFDKLGHTYSIIGGEYAFLLHLVLIFWIIKSAWKFLDRSLKNHAFLALAINTPLIMFFGIVYEFRNWSIMYPTFIILIAFYFKEKIKEAGFLSEA